MGTYNDNLTGGYDTAFWDEYTDSVSVNQGAANNQYEMDYTVGTTYINAGLVSKIVYDMGAGGAANLKATPTKLSTATEHGFILFAYIDADNYYRLFTQTDGPNVFYAQKRVSATPTTLGSGTLTTGTPVNKVHQIDFPTTGDDVRMIVDGTEEAADATYALSSRDCYFRVGAEFGSETGGPWECDFDTLEMTSPDYGASSGSSNLLTLGVG